MIRTFGIGPQVKNKITVWKGTFGRKRRQIPQKCGNNALGKMTVFGPLWDPWMVISCENRRPCFDNVPNVSYVFVISDALFIMF